ncbi:MAG TPA: hypothetical protein VHY80_16490 [Stellaceae bacterium]|jgi:hypothetical protein|nr:hypothetical protein [Stellaceae bacterium]
MSDRSNNHPEAEIIPPGAPDPMRWADRRGNGPERARVWAWSNDPRYTGLRRGRPGPLALVAIFIALAALGAVGFFVFLGALAFTLPLIGAVVLVGVIGGILRRL